MKKILIYGDSNVWGDNFLTGVRIPDQNQWSNILSKSLGNNYKILQEGLPGRLAGNDEIEKPFKNGKDSFLAVFRTKLPYAETYEHELDNREQEIVKQLTLTL